MNPLGNAIISLELILVSRLSAIQTVCASQEGRQMSLLSVFDMDLQLTDHRNSVLSQTKCVALLLQWALRRI